MFGLHVCVCTTCVPASSGTRVTDDWELPCGYLEFNLRSLEEQPMLSTAEVSGSAISKVS